MKKDFSLIVVDGEVGLGNGCVMPAGPLRENPARALARADAILVMGEDRAGVAQHIQALAPKALPILGARLTPTAAARTFEGLRVYAFAGIGRPQKFFASLRAVGGDIAGLKAFPDHYSFKAADISVLKAAARGAGAQLVTTEKDYVRLHPADAEGIATLAVEVAFGDTGQLLSILSPILTKAVHGRP